MRHIGSQSWRPRPTAGIRRLEALAALVARVRLYPFLSQTRHCHMCCFAGLGLRLPCHAQRLVCRKLPHNAACLTHRLYPERVRFGEAEMKGKHWHLQGMQEAVPMAVGVALSTADSREDMAAMGLSKGAMRATAMVALQLMAPSKATAGTPTMLGATLAETLLSGGRRLVTLSVKACNCHLLVSCARLACVSRVGTGSKAPGMQIYADVFRCHLYTYL